VLRCVLGLAALVAALAVINGGLPREPDIDPPSATLTAPPGDPPPRKHRVEPVRIFSRPAPPVVDEPPLRLPAAERITANPSAPVPMRRAPTDYQDLRRELLRVE
jgi:hypothetical protein